MHRLTNLLKSFSFNNSVTLTQRLTIMLLKYFFFFFVEISNNISHCNHLMHLPRPLFILLLFAKKLLPNPQCSGSSWKCIYTAAAVILGCRPCRTLWARYGCYRVIGSWEVYKLDLYFFYLFCWDASTSDSLACIILSVSNRQSVSATAPFNRNKQ